MRNSYAMVCRKLVMLMMAIVLFWFILAFLGTGNLGASSGMVYLACFVSLGCAVVEALYGDISLFLLVVPSVLVLYSVTAGTLFHQDPFLGCLGFFLTSSLYFGVYYKLDLFVSRLFGVSIADFYRQRL